MRAMAATYDIANGQVFVRTAEGEFGWTSDIQSAQVLLDYDVNGNVIGIEVLW